MLDLAEIQRRLNNIACHGTVTQVDYAGGLCRVRVADRETGWLPVPGIVGANFRAWHPLRIGTQVLLVSPSGDPANAIISQVLYSMDLATPAMGAREDVILFDDGFKIRYDSDGQVLEIDAPGEIRIKVAGDASVEGNGNITVKAAADITVEAGGSLTLKAGSEIRVQAGGVLHLDGSAIRALEG